MIKFKLLDFYRRPSKISLSGQLTAVNKPYVLLVCSIASIAGFLFGYDLNVMIGGLIFLKSHFELTPVQLGFAVSCATLGSAAGAVVGGYVSDWLGRKKTLALTAIIFAFGSIGTAIPTTIIQFDVFRIIGGIGVGLASVVAPMFIAEISPADLRGRLVLIDQLAILTGAVISVTICYLLSATGNWRAMFATEVVPAVLLLVGVPIIPESPRWLLEKNAVSEARKALGKVYLGSEAIDREVREITKSLEERAGAFGDLLHPGLRRALMIIVILAIFVQFTGIAPLDFYLPLVFQQAGFQKASDALFQMAIVNSWMFICTVIAIWLVDSIGRRLLLIAGLAGMAVGMFLLGAMFAYGITGELVVVVTVFCKGCFIASLAPIFWLLASELFPTRLRSKGMGIASLTQWTASFASIQVIPSMMAYAEGRFHTIAAIFWLFAVICGGAIVFSYYMIPETKNRSLEEIGQSWTSTKL
jgi:SP family arabinose:H+ symporter-like MFS transporter